MFVRKKKNKSGSVSVQVIDKTKGYRVFKTIGSATDPGEIKRLVIEARRVVDNHHPGQLKLLSVKSKESLAIKAFAETLSNAQVRTLGPELVFGVFNSFKVI